MDIEEALEIAQELDGMECDVTSWEADFLANILPLLRQGHSMSEKQEAVLLKMKKKYLDEDDDADRGDGDEELGEG